MLTCPKCKSEDTCIESAIQPYMDNEFQQDFSCNDCEFEWTNITEPILVARLMEPHLRRVDVPPPQRPAAVIEVTGGVADVTELNGCRVTIIDHDDRKERTPEDSTYEAQVYDADDVASSEFVDTQLRTILRKAWNAAMWLSDVYDSGVPWEGDIADRWNEAENTIRSLMLEVGMDPDSKPETEEKRTS